MAKYSFEFKKNVVLAYINGEGGYGYLSKTYGVPAQRNIEQWVHNYQTFGGIIELVYIVLQSVVKPGITGFFKIDLHIKCYIYLS